MWKPAHPARTATFVVVAVVFVAAAWVPLPYYSEGPGPARDVLSRISYAGDRPRYDPSGSLQLTTVRYRQLTPLSALVAWLD
ncbi:MAG TPA: hypothetical protein VJM84_00115, partial [Actinomycetota bacterium]|nr:hypothetical protein [Actinomycetota bacterium]